MADDGDTDDPTLDPLIENAVRQLRAPVPARDEWRRRLLEEAGAEQDGNHLVSRRWVVRPVLAIAAAIGFVLLGAGGATVIALRMRPAVPLQESAVASISAPAGPVAAIPAAVVRFVLVAPDARHVSIVGDFNEWNPSVESLRRLGDGRTWVVELRLAPGRYAYAFVVDGRLTPDPSAPASADDDFGVTNSVVMVRSGSS